MGGETELLIDKHAKFFMRTLMMMPGAAGIQDFTSSRIVLCRSVLKLEIVPLKCQVLFFYKNEIPIFFLGTYSKVIPVKIIF